MIIVFKGPPFAGKESQSKLLSEKYKIPVFSMGAIIRDAYKKKDPRAVEGFEKYSMKGLHVPIKLKFDLLKEKINAYSSFILDNFPANKEDLDALIKYFKKRSLKIDYVFYLNIDENEIFKRITRRERKDDDPKIIKKRIEIQEDERIPVLKYFKKKDILYEINGHGSVEEVFDRITKHIK